MAFRIQFEPMNARRLESLANDGTLAKSSAETGLAGFKVRSNLCHCHRRVTGRIRESRNRGNESKLRRLGRVLQIAHAYNNSAQYNSFLAVDMQHLPGLLCQKVAKFRRFEDFRLWSESK